MDKHLRCPITLELFDEPDMLNDDINELLKHKNLSPITKKPLSIDKAIPNISMKQLVNEYKTSNNILIKNQTISQHIFNLDIFSKIQTLNEQLDYINNSYGLDCANNKYNIKPIHYACCFSTHQVILKMIDKGVNLEYENINKWRPIHFACCFSTPEVILKMIDKGVNLECETNNKWRPIHYACYHSTPEVILKMIDKGVNLECENISKLRPIHLACCFSTPQVILKMIDKGVNLECETIGKWRPIHFVCQFSTPEVILKMIDKGVDLECEDNDKWRPIHLACCYSTSEVILKMIDKGIDLECENNKKCRPIHLASAYSNANVVKYLIDHGADFNKCINFMNIIQLELFYKKTNELKKLVKYKNRFSFQLIKKKYKYECEQLLNNNPTIYSNIWICFLFFC